MVLKKNTAVTLSGGGDAKVIKILGQGGQGTVYLVNVAGKSKAMKWYDMAPSDDFYRNIERNIHIGAPSAAFLWPEKLTAKIGGSFGYIMPLKPQNYYGFGDLLMAKTTFKSLRAMFTAAKNICIGFMMLHRLGYSYQDLNDGNFFIDPATGKVLIGDNDNVMPQGEKSGIKGKARYMSPEVVNGGTPDKYSDRFSLSVILFMLIYGNHPFEGAKVASCPCMTEDYERRFYGRDITFIYDPSDRSNLPVKGLHQNVIRRWAAFPKELRDTFTHEFSHECISHPQSRMLELEWDKLISGLIARIAVCPDCGNEFFI